MSLELWTIYDHPLDFPYGYIARKFVDSVPTETSISSSRLEQLRDIFRKQQLTVFLRDDKDDPCIIETWF